MRRQRFYALKKWLKIELFRLSQSPLKHYNERINSELSKITEKYLKKIMTNGELFELKKIAKNGVSGILVNICDMLEFGLYACEELENGNKKLFKSLITAINFIDGLIKKDINVNDFVKTSPTLKALLEELFKAGKSYIPKRVRFINDVII